MRIDVRVLAVSTDWFLITKIMEEEKRTGYVIVEVRMPACNYY